MGLRGKLGVIALVYVIEGYPMGVFRDVWPVYFRTHGVPLATIGALSGLSLAWSLKALWSPLVDRFGERRRWIAGPLLVMCAAGLAMAARGPEPDALLWLAMIVFCAASATQDVAIDAYTIGLVDRGEEGPANGVRITAYRVALLAAGTGLLLLPARFSWPVALGVAALVPAAMAATLAWAPRIEVPLAARREFWAPLWRWLSRPGAPAVFAFVLLYRIGDIGMGPMVSPFWVDRGLSLDEIAFVKNALGVLATIAGAALGAWVVAVSGIGRALLVLGALALLSNLGYAVTAAYPGSGPWPVYAASAVESLCAGLASAGFLSYLMRICEKEHAAVQYALLTAVYALPGTFAAAVSGFLTEELGYAAFFALTGLLALPAFVFLPRARRWIATGA
jgi:PAT family beta-lactamase induction signal transducer AmpG